MFQDIFFPILWNISNISCSPWSVNISFKHSTTTIISMRFAQTCSISTWQSFSYKHCIIPFDHTQHQEFLLRQWWPSMTFVSTAPIYIKTNLFFYYMVIKGTFDLFYFFIPNIITPKGFVTLLVWSITP